MAAFVVVVVVVFFNIQKAPPNKKNEMKSGKKQYWLGVGALCTTPIHRQHIFIDYTHMNRHFGPHKRPDSVANKLSLFISLIY